MKRAGIITQARTTSTRLPRKVLIEVGDKTVLDHHLDRLTASGLPVYVATTVNDTDTPIAELATARGIDFYRGSESDVLTRFDETARTFELDVVVRVTSDCPLIDGRLIADAVETFLAEDDACLYLSNVLNRTFPRGFDFEVFSAKALTDAAAIATDPAQREHVTPYLYASGNPRMTTRDITWHDDKSGYRVTLDTADDLDLIRALIEEHHAERLDCSRIIGVLDEHPELVSLNAHVEQKKLAR